MLSFNEQCLRRMGKGIKNIEFIFRYICSLWEKIWNCRTVSLLTVVDHMWNAPIIIKTYESVYATKRGSVRCNSIFSPHNFSLHFPDIVPEAYCYNENTNSNNNSSWSALLDLIQSKFKGFQENPFILVFVSQNWMMIEIQRRNSLNLWNPSSN